MFKVGDRVKINWSVYDHTVSEDNDKIKKWDEDCGRIHTVTGYSQTDKYNHELDGIHYFSFEELLLVNESTALKFKYKNWKGQTRDRIVSPINIWFGHTDYHKENQ